MDKVQLVFFFLSGFFLSRLIIKVRWPERLVYFFISERHISLSRTLFYLIALSAFLSFFIPNAITVLTLLPMLELLRKAFSAEGTADRKIATVLALSAIYGANIGGMGSITATPANGVLATYAELYQIPGAEKLTFAGWLVWGIPLVILMVLAAWLVLAVLFRLWGRAGNRVHLPFDEAVAAHPHQKIAAWMAAIYFLSALALSALMMEFPAHATALLVVTGVVTAGLCGVMFLFPVANKEGGSRKQPLLSVRDCYSNLPLRGFGFVALAVIFAGVLYLFRADKLIADMITRFLPAGLPAVALYFMTAVSTSFATEVLSNTAVQLSLFVVIVPLAKTLLMPPVPALIIVTLSSTCAFMSPIATGVNGLAFGGVRHVSFTRMMMAGFVMNLVGAVIITFWISTVVAGLMGL